MFIVTDKNDTFANMKESKSLKNQITGEELNRMPGTRFMQQYDRNLATFGLPTSDKTK